MTVNGTVKKLIAIEGKCNIVPTGGSSSVIVLQSKTVSPSASQQTVTPDSGYYGLDSVSIEAVTSTVDNNIIAENIKKGISILGVTGTLETGSSGVDTSGDTVTADVMRSGYTAHDASGTKVTGNIPNVSIRTGSITVNDDGLVNYSVSVDSGYVEAATVGKQKQLDTHAGVTITSNQTLAVAGRYMTGDIVVDVPQSGSPPTPTAGNTPVLSVLGCERGTSTSSISELTDMSFTINVSGTYRIKFTCLNTYTRSGANAIAKVYVNHVARSTEHIVPIRSEATQFVYYEDIELAQGDVITIGVKAANSTYGTYVTAIEACIDWDNGF